MHLTQGTTKRPPRKEARRNRARCDHPDSAAAGMVNAFIAIGITAMAFGTVSTVWDADALARAETDHMGDVQSDLTTFAQALDRAARGGHVGSFVVQELDLATESRGFLRSSQLSGGLHVGSALAVGKATPTTPATPATPASTGPSGSSGTTAKAAAPALPPGPVGSLGLSGAVTTVVADQKVEGPFSPSVKRIVAGAPRDDPGSLTRFDLRFTDIGPMSVARSEDHFRVVVVEAGTCPADATPETCAALSFCDERRCGSDATGVLWVLSFFRNGGAANGAVTMDNWPSTDGADPAAALWENNRASLGNGQTLNLLCDKAWYHCPVHHLKSKLDGAGTNVTVDASGQLVAVPLTDPKANKQLWPILFGRDGAGGPAGSAYDIWLVNGHRAYGTYVIEGSKTLLAVGTSAATGAASQPGKGQNGPTSPAPAPAPFSVAEDPEPAPATPIEMLQGDGNRLPPPNAPSETLAITFRTAEASARTLHLEHGAVLLEQDGRVTMVKPPAFEFRTRADVPLLEATLRVHALDLDVNQGGASGEARLLATLRGQYEDVQTWGNVAFRIQTSKCDAWQSWARNTLGAAGLAEDVGFTTSCDDHGLQLTILGPEPLAGPRDILLRLVWSEFHVEVQR